MPIYVAGPVVRPNVKQLAWVTECYNVMNQFVRSRPQYKARLPVSEAHLERMDASTFAREISQAIRNSDNVIAVFLQDDQSVPVECALAAAASKRVLIFHESSTRIPRILAGHPLVTTAVFGHSAPQRIEIFLMR